MPLTSIAHSTGTEATGISASTQDTLAETTSSSDALTSTPYTEADTAGTGTEEEAGTADVLMADHILMATKNGNERRIQPWRLRTRTEFRQHDTPKQHTHHRDTRSPDGKQPLIR